MRAALIVVAAYVAAAGLADFIAADAPIAYSLDGELRVGSNLERGAVSRARGTALSRRLGPGDWALWPPIRHDPAEVRTGGELEILQPPSRRHLLGTDDRGRDVAARLVHGARTSLMLAATAALLAAALGMLVASAALLWRRLDGIIGAAVDSVGSLPILVVAVAVQGLWGRGSLVMAAALIALPRAAESARLARAAMRAADSREFALAARAGGAGRVRLWASHLAPFCWRPLAVAAMVTAATAVVAEAGLSFVGFGAPPPMASWGELLRQAADHELRWWLAMPAGVATVALAAALGRLARGAGASETL